MLVYSIHVYMLVYSIHVYMHGIVNMFIMVELCHEETTLIKHDMVGLKTMNKVRKQ